MIEISSFLNHSCECGRLRSQKHHLLVEGTIEVIVEGKHLGSIIYFGTVGMLAPFLEPLVGFPISHLACVHLGDGLYLCLGWYKLFLEGHFEIGPWSVVRRCVAQGSGHEIVCPFASLCSLFEMCEGSCDLLIGIGVDALVNAILVLKCVPKGEGPFGFAIKMFRWHPKKLLADLGHDGYCGY